ncbi:hypothetical protein L6654_42755 [Bradyrhizobium sp. WYCCWR 13023]|uniref:Uncharacterized protein n=1 Tax=Bradyrhizobium zhengyangense TaxID=2911009 RepID=A0A9X1RLB3_9BRAD|nr:hypothetical protein [Bradyrhizobium zhengyangense]MCG2633233.1 hypothetical protein [Bradyrhizobium zhengyangense]
MPVIALPHIESWVPAAVNHEAVRLYDQLVTEEKSADGLKVLSRLICDPRMKVVWQELYKTKRNEKYETTDIFLHPAHVSHLSWAAEYRKQALELRKKGGEENERAVKLLEAEAAAEEGIEDFGADPRWSEQDRAAQLFLRQACRSAIDIEPVYLSEIQTTVAKLRTVAAGLRTLMIRRTILRSDGRMDLHRLMISILLVQSDAAN